MAEGHRLRRLKMGEAGHHGRGMLLGAFEEGGDQPLQCLGDAMELVLDPEPEVDGHLVVARACSVQASGGGADQFGKARLDIHVDVFEPGREGELAVLDFSQDRVQAVSDFLLIASRNNARFRQHLGVGDGPSDVLGIQLLVEADRGVDRFHDRSRARGKTSAPHLVAGLLVAHRDTRAPEKID